MEEWTTTELVHRAILEDAAIIANLRAQKDGIDPPKQHLRAGERFSPGRVRTGFASGDIFRADPVASRRGGLCLTIEPSVTYGAPSERIAYLHQIGKEAIIEAINKNKTQFVGLILGHMRNRDNYFDRFTDDTSHSTENS